AVVAVASDRPQPPPATFSTWMRAKTRPRRARTSARTRPPRGRLPHAAACRARAGETIRGLVRRAASPYKGTHAGIGNLSGRFIHQAARRTPPATSMNQRRVTPNEQPTITRVQARDAAQVSRWRRADRRRRGGDAAGLARADDDLEIPVDLAHQGHLPRIRR